MEKAIFISTVAPADFERFREILEIFPQDRVVHVKSAEEVLDAPPPFDPSVCLVDGRADAAATLEWVQILRSSYDKTSILVFHQGTNELDVTALKKNGANHLMHFDFDQEFIVDLILSESQWDFGSHPPVQTLQALSATDLDESTSLGFDLFAHLPHNNRTIRLRKKGDVMREGMLDKVAKQGQQVYFKKSDQKEVFEYLQTIQEKTGHAPDTIGEVKSKRRFYEFMSEFFEPSANFESGKKILAHCKEIVADLGLSELHPPEFWSSVLTRRSGLSRTFYTEAMNLAYFAAGFAQLTGAPPADVESLALSGLLHNIGLSRVPGYRLGNDVNAFEKSAQDLYFNYPVASVTMIKNKKVPLPEVVTEIILQHRERANGTGFPNKFGKDKLHPLSTIFHIAVRFQELTFLDDKASKRLPLEALKMMNEEALAGREPLDFTKLGPILKKLR
jgi:HD-GYP domain-containing protein (c-di-GMP phosphodiesterase class II)